MKGPGMRLDLDVRRLWKCPACGHEARSEGHVVTRICHCTREGVAMRLTDVPRPVPTVRLPTPDDDVPEFADFPTDIPVNPQPKRPLTETAEGLTPLRDEAPPVDDAPPQDEGPSAHDSQA